MPQGARKEYLVDILGSLVVRREPEDLLEVGEGLVDVVLVVEAEATDVDGVHVGAVLPQEVVGDLASMLYNFFSSLQMTRPKKLSWKGLPGTNAQAYWVH